MTIAAPDPRWADRARELAAQVTALIEDWLVEGIEHIGSTAVPGLAAKPTIDLLAPVTDIEATATASIDGLAATGWCFVPPELDSRPWRRFFVLPDASGTRREAHLYLIGFADPRWHEQLAFRDALRRDETLARRYEDLKRRLADEYRDDREGYTKAKAAFVAEILADLAGGTS